MDQHQTKFNTFKRPRLSDNLPSKKFHGDSTYLPDDPYKSEFYHILTKRGLSKVFWYFPCLVPAQSKLIKSEWIISKSGRRWRVILKNNHTIGLFVELGIQGLPDNFRYSTTITIDTYLTNYLKRVEKKSEKFTESFTFARRDWGFPNLLDYSQHLRRPLVFELSISQNFSSADSKEIAGYVGLINEGTTCYMNSLLQTLFCLTYFRKAVYSMPAEPEDSDSIAFALQQVFYNLQCQSTAVSTRDLLLSFGWGLEQWHVQHDVQEFNCKLADTLQSKMMGTRAEGTYSQLFQGQMKNQIQCINVEFKSENFEDFTDVQLNVRNFGTIYESLQSFVDEERLEGENQYNTKDYGQQDARKKFIFTKLPAVLQIQLKRFDYDRRTGMLTKVNDYFEFYQELDMGPFTQEIGDSRYLLFSVLVHSGRLNAGHYFAYICPKLDGKWFKFNDSLVTPSSVQQAVENNRGGADVDYTVIQNMKLKKETILSDTSAYMLVYVKQSKKNLLLADLSMNDIPYELHNKIERAESQRVHTEQILALQESYCEVTIITFEMIEGWNGPGICPSNSSLYGNKKFKDRDYLQLRMKKTDLVQDLKNKLKKHTHGDCRVWSFNPSFKNWELQLGDRDFPIESMKRVLYVEAFNKEPICNNQDGWKLIENVDHSTEGSRSSREVEFVGASSTFLIFYKLMNAGDMRLINYEVVIQPSLKNVRGYFASNVFNGAELPMTIYLEKSSGEIVLKFMPEQDAVFGENHKVGLNNGDVFIAEVDSDISVNRYLLDFADNVEIRCRFYDKLENSGYCSYSKQLLQQLAIPSCLTIEFNLTKTQIDLMDIIAQKFNIQREQVELFTNRTSSRTPVVLQCYGLQHKNEFSEILKQGSYILFDLSPFPVSEMIGKSLVYLQILDQNMEFHKQMWFLVKNVGTLRDLHETALDAQFECNELVDSHETVWEFGYVLLTHPHKAIIDTLKMITPLEHIACKKNLTLCMRSKTHREKKLLEDQQTHVMTKQRISVFQYFESETGTQYYHPYFEYVQKTMSCKEVAQLCKSRYEVNVKVMIATMLILNEFKYELKDIRRLEENDDNFVNKYPRKHVAIEHFSGEKKNALVIKDQ